MKKNPLEIYEQLLEEHRELQALEVMTNQLVDAIDESSLCDKLVGKRDRPTSFRTSLDRLATLFRGKAEEREARAGELQEGIMKTLEGFHLTEAAASKNDRAQEYEENQEGRTERGF